MAVQKSNQGGKAPSSGAVKNPSNLDGIVGLHDASSLDALLAVQHQASGVTHLPCELVIRAIQNELASGELDFWFADLTADLCDQLDLKELINPLQRLPGKLYFLLWHLENSQTVPVEGLITSHQLKKALYHLARYLTILELLLKRSPNSLPLYQNLGYIHIDLAGIVRYAKQGLSIKGRQLNYSCLLRKAITCFQISIKLEAFNAREIEASHQDVMRLLDDDFDFRENRTLLYLNPWHFLYIASTLQLLNDKEGFKLYLEKARTILDAVSDHQNVKIQEQKKLLESVYNILKYGGSVRFDFDKTNLLKLRKRLKRIRMNRHLNGRSSYSPLVEEALAQQFETQSAFLHHGVLNPEQMGYLQGVFTLYNEVHVSPERDRLIYRFNIPPLRIGEVKPAMRRLLAPKAAIGVSPTAAPLQPSFVN